MINPTSCAQYGKQQINDTTFALPSIMIKRTFTRACAQARFRITHSCTSDHAFPFGFVAPLMFRGRYRQQRRCSSHARLITKRTTVEQSQVHVQPRGSLCFFGHCKVTTELFKHLAEQRARVIMCSNICNRLIHNQQKIGQIHV